MKISTKTILIGGLIGGYGFFTIAEYVRMRNAYYRNTIHPLSNISKEAEEFDINPKDSTLSIQESERFILEKFDTDKNKFLDDREKMNVLGLFDQFRKEPFGNTQETAKNMLAAMDFISIRQSVNSPQGYPKQERPRELNYSDFYRLAFGEEKPLLKKIVLQNGRDKLLAIFLDNSKNEVTIPSDISSLKDLADKLTEKKITVEIEEKENGNAFLNLLLFMAPMGLTLLFFLWLFGRGGGMGGMGGLSKFTGLGQRSLQKEKISKVTFKDVAGIDEAKVELKEVVDFLKDPYKFVAIGARAPKGVLLVGPPGTGKTLLAKAVAGEANVPFFNLSGSDFVEMFVGVGASRVRDLFQQAKKFAPCVIFIDEIDAVGRHRGAGIGGGHDEREQTLNQLLTEMDGFSTGQGIVVLAATNRPDILDNALLRPGRFDRQVVVDRPDVKGREGILIVHSRGKPFADDVDLKVIAQRTAGFTGADLENVLNEAAILTGRKEKTRISMQEIEEAIDKVIAGPEKKSRVLSPELKNRISVHELGHTLVSYYEEKNGAMPFHKVSIIPRGMALGLTWSLPEEDRLLLTKSQLLAEVKVLLGGRVAEEIVFGDVSTGAQNDLERATKILREMITKYGMSEKLGLRTFDEQSGNIFLGKELSHSRTYSEDIAKQIDEEINKIMNRLHGEVKVLLTSKRNQMDILAKVLLEKETIERNEFENLLSEIESGKLKASS